MVILVKFWSWGRLLLRDGEYCYNGVFEWETIAIDYQVSLSEITELHLLLARFLHVSSCSK